MLAILKMRSPKGRARILSMHSGTQGPWGSHFPRKHQRHANGIGNPFLSVPLHVGPSSISSWTCSAEKARHQLQRPKFLLKNKMFNMNCGYSFVSIRCSQSESGKAALSIPQKKGSCPKKPRGNDFFQFAGKVRAQKSEETLHYKGLLSLQAWTQH